MDTRHEIETEEYYQNRDYIKSNLLIGAKYKSSLTSNKIMSLSLYHIAEAKENSEGSLTVTMSAAMLKKELGLSGGSFYDMLSTAAKSMTGRSIGISNPEKDEFHYMAVVTNADYKDGEFSITYNKDLNRYLRNITKSFTRLSLPIMLSFSSVFSFRLYELLRSKSYTPKGIYNPENKYKISMSVAELKLSLGVVNAELERVQRILNGSEQPDYERAVEASPEKVFNTWSEFRRSVIDVAVNEINEKADIKVQYEPLKKGRGGKVYAIDFYVAVGDNHLQKKVLSEDEKTKVLDEIADLIEEKIRVTDIIAIAEASEYDFEKVKEKYELSKRHKIENLTGWLINAIENDYKEVEAEAKNSTAFKKTRNNFNNFEQNEYDFAELEKKLLNS